MKIQWRRIALLLTLTLLLSSTCIIPVFAAAGSAASAAKKEVDAIKYGTYKGVNAKGIPVITYHYVVSDAEKRSGYRNSSLAVSKSTFEKQMKWLRSINYRTINCEELYLWHTGKIRLPERSVLITFDDGYECLSRNAYPILKKYNMKGTVFIVGSWTYNKPRSIDAMNHKKIRWMQKDNPNFEFQSHTYNLHSPTGSQSGYSKALQDAEKMKKVYGFKYLAYPYGRFNMPMVRAYRKSGIKMAFAYGDNNYALRSQNIMRIRRIKVGGNDSMNQFTRWFK